MTSGAGAGSDRAAQRARPWAPRRVVRSAGVLAVAVAGLVASWVLAGPASAHAQLVNSDPGDGATLATAPAQVRLRLSEAVLPGSTTVVLTDGVGRTVSGTTLSVESTAPAAGGPGGGGAVLITRPGDPRVPATVVVTLPALGMDVYHLAWQTLSADDLHSTSGVIVFGIGRTVAPHSGRVEDPLPAGGEVALRWVGTVGTALAAGALLLALLAGGLPGAAVLRRLCLFAAAAAGVAALADAVLPVVQAAGARGAGEVLAAVLRDGYAARLGLRETAVLGLAVLCLAGRSAASAGRRPGRLVTAAAVVLVLLAGTATALLGHAGQPVGVVPVRVLVEGAHVAAALVWGGAVVGAALAAWWAGPAGAPDTPQLRIAVLRRFGVLAAGCVSLLAVTGLMLTGQGVRSLDAALYSTYGRLLLLKVVLVAVVVAAGGVNTLLLRAGRLPGWIPARLVARLRPALLRRVVVAEALGLAAVLLLAGAVASSRPAVGAEWQPAATAMPLQAGQADDLVETVQVSPNRPGRNFLTVDAFDSRRPSPGPVRQVSAVLRQVGGDPVTVDLTDQGGGRWLAATDVLTSPGAWTLRVTARRAGLPDAVAGYDWFVADPSARLTAPMVSSADWAPALDGLAMGVLGAVVLVGSIAAVRRRRTRVVRGGLPAAAPPGEGAPGVHPQLAGVGAAAAGRSAQADPDPGESGSAIGG